MRFLVLDFETLSACDLIKRGTYQYVRHRTTDILVLCVLEMIDGVTTRRWTWGPESCYLPFSLIDAVKQADGLAAHNAAFDSGIWEFVGEEIYGFPPVAKNKWYCTSAHCRVNALPASLDHATQALSAKAKKSAFGKSLIKQLCIPRPDGTFNKDPELMKQLGLYCAQDVNATAGLLKCTRLMTQSEYTDYKVNEAINQRGIGVDLELAILAQRYAAQETAELAGKLDLLTSSQVTKHTQIQRCLTWVGNQFWKYNDNHPVKRQTIVYKDGGKKYSLDQAVRKSILDMSLNEVVQEDQEALGKVQEVLALVDIGNKSSVKKFATMEQMAANAGDHARVHGAFVYAGAQQTLRFSSRGLQLHNFKRDCFSPQETERLKSQMRRHEELTDVDGKPLKVMDTLSRLLRPALIPAPGHEFCVFDWSSIEARILPWLANTRSAEKYLDLFRQGQDVYTHTAERAGFIGRRDIGKVMVLAFGFGGAYGAFKAAERIYSVTLPDHEIHRLVRLWRRQHDWAEQFWNALEQTAFRAIRNPNKKLKAGHSRVEYEYLPQLMGGTLACYLPGNCVIQYPQARIEEIEAPWGMREGLTSMKASRKPKKEAKEWSRVTLWRGILAENVTQAFAACLLRHKLKELPRLGIHVVGDTHDEIIAEVSAKQVSEGVDTQMQTFMRSTPDFAKGLPLGGDAVLMPRYGKH